MSVYCVKGHAVDLKCISHGFNPKKCHRGDISV